ncbi:MAG: MFS transporter [Novosphingobium sp.]|nr:MFS transporter [Novosphingobium sp.]
MSEKAMTTPVGEPSGEAVSGRAMWLLIISLWISEATGMFETAMIFAAQRALTEDFGGPVMFGWLVTSYLLVGAAAAALAGRLGDIFGRRRVMLVILGIGLAGSLTSAMTSWYPLVLAGRAMQGATGAILPLCIGLTRENLPPAKVPLGIGLMISGASAGTAAGLVIGGFLVDTFSWHAVFVASAVFALIAMLGVRRFVPPSPVMAARGRIDWMGGVLFVPAILMLLAAISHGPGWGLFDARTIAAAASGLALLAFWIRMSLRSSNPLFDVRLFADRRVAIGNAITALVCMSAMQITLVFSLLLQAPRWTAIGLGASATVAGLIKLPSNISSLAAGPLSGWLTARGGGRITMMMGGAICSIGWLFAMAFHESVLQIAIVLIVISFGTTILFAVAPTIIAAAVPQDRTSEAVGTMTVVRQIFLGIGAQVISVILASDTVASPAGDAHFPSANAFMLTMGTIALICACATALGLALPRNAGMERTRPPAG